MPSKQSVLTELSGERLLNAKIFKGQDFVNNRRVGHFHCGHIHYFNKLGAGDGDRRMREIDWILKAKTGGWGFDYHSFNPFVPTYSDDWALFRDLFEDKDRIIGFKALCKNKVKGILISNGAKSDIGNPDWPETSGVVYKDAFETGIDLMYYFTRSQMKKVAQINNCQDIKSDVVLEWEVKLPEMEDKRKKMRILEGADKSLIDNEFDTIDKVKNLKTDKSLLLGFGKVDDKKENFTYLKGSRAWNNKGQNVPVIVEFLQKGNKLYLRKTLLAKDLNKEQGSVWTDTSASYYPGAGDGGTARYMPGSGEALATIRASAGNQVAGTGTTSSWGAVINPRGDADWPNTNYLSREHFPFVTTGLSPTINLTGVSLVIVPNSVYDYWSAEAQSRIDVTQSTQASTSSLATADYLNLVALNSPEIAATVDLGSLSVGTPHEFVFDPAYFDWVDLSGNTLIALREGHDVDNDNVNSKPPDNAYYSGLVSRCSEYANTSSDPYLSLTYIIPGGGQVSVFSNSGFSMI